MIAAIRNVSTRHTPESLAERLIGNPGVVLLRSGKGDARRAADGVARCGRVGTLHFRVASHDARLAFC